MDIFNKFLDAYCGWSKKKINEEYLQHLMNPPPCVHHQAHLQTHGAVH